MSDPLALFPLALAAAGGRIDAYSARQLVAAGLTLKQRSIALVRALSAGPSGILLPPSPAFLVALAASDGQGAVLFNAAEPPDLLALRLADVNFTVLFTTRALAARIAAGIDARVPIIVLDEAPAQVTLLIDGRTSNVDLGTHYGIPLEGDPAVPGLDEVCVWACDRTGVGAPRRTAMTHRELLAQAREYDQAKALAATNPIAPNSTWSEPHTLIEVAAALLRGAVVRTGSA